MATTTSLGIINMFNSLASFNSNKNSVAANDLNFIKQTATEMSMAGGGIVAQSLGKNGYVKFANGLIRQWGNVSMYVSNSNIIFPISMRVAYSAQISFGGNGTRKEVPAISSLTATRLQVVHSAQQNANLSLYWTVIGGA